MYTPVQDVSLIVDVSIADVISRPPMLVILNTSEYLHVLVNIRKSNGCNKKCNFNVNDINILK